jgi:hypothetical protein
MTGGSPNHSEAAITPYASVDPVVLAPVSVLSDAEEPVPPLLGAHAANALTVAMPIAPVAAVFKKSRRDGLLIGIFFFHGLLPFLPVVHEYTNSSYCRLNSDTVYHPG